MAIAARVSTVGRRQGTGRGFFFIRTHAGVRQRGRAYGDGVGRTWASVRRRLRRTRAGLGRRGRAGVRRRAGILYAVRNDGTTLYTF